MHGYGTMSEERKEVKDQRSPINANDKAAAGREP